MFSFTLAIFYISSVFLFFSSYSNFLFWVILEINILCFLLVSSSFFNGGDFHPISNLYYFIVQSIGSILFFFSLTLELFSSSLFFFSIFLMGLFIKSGLFPFHSWLVSICRASSPALASLILSVQKIPLLYFIFSIHSDSCFFFLLLCMIAGSFMMLNCSPLPSLLVYSSLYSTYWTFFLFCSDFSLFLLYFFLYFVYTYTILKLPLLNHSPALHIAHVFFLGLPPFSMFFFNFFIIDYLFDFQSFAVSLFIWICVFISTVGYFKHFYGGFFKISLPYSGSSMNSQFQILFSALLYLTSFFFLSAL